MSVAGAVMASTVASANPAQPVSDTSPTTNTCEPYSLVLRFMGLNKSGVTFCEKGQKAFVPIDSACDRIKHYAQSREDILHSLWSNEEEFKKINPTLESPRDMQKNIDVAKETLKKLSCSPLVS
jgi:hypothetical protein